VSTRAAPIGRASYRFILCKNWIFRQERENDAIDYSHRERINVGPARLGVTEPTWYTSYCD